jgi:hypothetical protein
MTFNPRQFSSNPGTRSPQPISAVTQEIPNQPKVQIQVSGKPISPLFDRTLTFLDPTGPLVSREIPDQISFDIDNDNLFTQDNPANPRPEIILISDFFPLWKREGSSLLMTEEGKYFYTMLMMRKLKYSLMSSETEKASASDPDFSKKLRDNFSQNKKVLTDLSSVYSEAYNFLTKKEKFLSWFNPTNKENSISLSKELSKVFFSESSFDEIIADNNNLFGNDYFNISSFLVDAGLTRAQISQLEASPLPNTKKIINISSLFKRLVLGEFIFDINSKIKFGSPSLFRVQQNGINSAQETLKMNSISLFVQNKIIDITRNWAGYDDTREEEAIGQLDTFKENFNRLLLCFPGIFPLSEDNPKKRISKICSFISQEISVSSAFVEKRGVLERLNGVKRSNIKELFWDNNPGSIEEFLSPINNVQSSNLKLSSPLFLRSVFQSNNFDDVWNFECFNKDGKISGFSTFFQNIFNIKENSQLINFENLIFDQTKTLEEFRRLNFVPFNYSEQKTSLTSPSGFFENIFSRFFNPDFSPKFEEEEVSSLIIHSQFDAENISKTGRLRDFLFRIIVSNAYSIDAGETRETYFDKDLLQIFRAIRSNSNIIYPSSYGNEDEPSIGFSEISPYFSFFDSFNDIDIKNPQKPKDEKNLFSIISSTVIDFYFLIKEKCLSPNEQKTYFGEFETLTILRVFYQLILDILNVFGGKFRPRAVKERDKKIYWKRPPISQTDINDFQSIKSEIFESLSAYEDKIRRSFCFLNYFFENNLQKIKELKDFSEKSSQVLNVLSQIYSGNTFSLNDISISLRGLKEMSELFSEENFEENGSPKLSFGNSTIVGEKIQGTFNTLMKADSDFFVKNKQKIISVGLPSGFFETLGEQSRVTGSISLSIYKIDLLNPLIVFKPKKFRFNIKRFDIKVNELFSIEPNVTDQINRVPSLFFSESESLFDFENPQVFFDWNEEINKNHVNSLLIEIYLKILSGFSLSEGDIIKNENFDDQISQILALIGSSNQDENGNLPLNSLSPSRDIVKKIVTPKKFDRVFNVIIDPDGFEIDQDKIDSPNDLSFFLSAIRSFSGRISFDCFFAQFSAE